MNSRKIIELSNCKYISFDTCALNHMHIEKINFLTLKDRLNAEGYIVLVGANTIRELAQKYTEYKSEQELSEKNTVDKQTCAAAKEEAPIIFAKLLQLKPFYPCATILYDHEIKKLNDEKHTFCFSNFDGFTKIVDSLRAGSTPKNLTAINLAHKADMNNIKRNWETSGLVGASSYKNSGFIECSGCTISKILDDSRWLDSLIEFLKQTIKISFNTNNLRILLENPKAYPAINSFIQTHVYLNYYVEKHKIAPTWKIFSDLRQLVESSYSEIFVTEDKKLLKYGGDINSQTKIMDVENFLKEFKISEF